MDEQTRREIEDIIEKTTTKTVLKLKMAGLMNDNREPTQKKTEILLQNYRAFQASDQPYTRKVVAKINIALEEIRDDKYYSIIPLTYFDNRSTDDVAAHFFVTKKTILRNKVRLLDKISALLFSDEVIAEILL